MLKVNLKTCPQVVTWTKGNSSLLHIALVTIQEMPHGATLGLIITIQKHFFTCAQKCPLHYFSWIAFHYTKCFYLIKSCLINWKQLPFYFLLSSTKWHWPSCGNQSGQQIKSCCSVDDTFIILNLTIYEFMMIQQTISQQCVLCWAKRELL